MGLGLVMETAYLLPLTTACLAVALAALSLQTRRRRGYGPLAVGGAAAGLLPESGSPWRKPRRVSRVRAVPPCGRAPRPNLKPCLESFPMRKKTIGAAILAAVLGGGLTAYTLAFAGGGGGPLVDPTRPDCPGLIVCPLTGEPVCADRCPLGAGAAQSEDVPSCCQPKE